MYVAPRLSAGGEETLLLLRGGDTCSDRLLPAATWLLTLQTGASHPGPCLATTVALTTGDPIEWVGPGMLLPLPQCPGRPRENDPPPPPRVSSAGGWGRRPKLGLNCSSNRHRQG